LLLEAYVQEIFHSIQGEGLHIGRPTCFIRFCGCNLRCDYCDTKSSWINQTLSELSPGTTMKNPLSSAVVAQQIDNYGGEYISLTGGEPLMHPDFIKETLKLLKTSKIILLETNGTLPNALEKIVNHVDIFSIDIKLDYWIEYHDQIKQFIKIIKDNKCDHYFKLVIDENWQSRSRLILEVLEYIGDAELVYQPQYGVNINIAELVAFNLDSHKNSYFIPQIHKYLDIK